MKRDSVIAIIIAVVVAAVCFGLAKMRPPFLPKPSQPFTSLSPSLSNAPAEHTIIEVNGEPITEKEFEVFTKNMPEDMQRQMSSEQGKQFVAEELVRYKLLEQQAQKTGVDQDPELKALLEMDRMNVTARAAMQKLVPAPTDAAMRTWYDQHKEMFDSIQLAHILIAYQGGQAPPRSGAPLSREAALKKAMDIEAKLKGGADFPAVARDESDDLASAQQGGIIGSVTHGMLPPELESRVFAMKPGETSPPIPSRFGVHIFKAGPRSLRPFADAKAFIAQQMQQEGAQQRVEEMRKTAKVVFDPKVFPAAKNWTSPPPPPKKPS